MAAQASNWDDLKVRVLSGAVMLAVGATAVILGGVWFQALVVFATAVMIWELWMMVEPDRPEHGMLLAVLTAALMPLSVAMVPLVLIIPVVGVVLASRERFIFFVYALAVAIGGLGLMWLRGDGGLAAILLLLLIVIVSDVAGYFAGRLLGGPKFWPKISPKKTWSGTVAGWIGAAVIGFAIVLSAGAPLMLVPVCVLISFAGQMGDIAESALKRRMGVKDSSALIPGHGGPLDRFDALLGAVLFALLLTTIFDVSGLTF